MDLGIVQIAGETSSSDDDYYDGAADEPVAAPEDESEEEEADEDVEIPVSAKSMIKYSNDYVVVPAADRRTSAIMSKAEMTEAVSIRATQIAQHNNCFVQADDLDDPVKMAKRELMMRMSPLTIERFVGYKMSSAGEMVGHFEYWSPNEMMFAVGYDV